MSDIRGMSAVGARDENSYYPFYISTFVLKEDVTNKDVKGYPLVNCGSIQNLGTIQEESTFTVSLGTQAIDNNVLSLLGFNQKESATAMTIDLPSISSGAIPSAGPYEIAVAGLTTNSIVSVTVLNVSKTPMIRAATAAPNTYQVAAGKLVFDASDAGKQVIIYQRKTLSVKTIGGENPIDRYDNVEIFGKICGSRLNDKMIWMPNCSSITGVNIDPKAEEMTRDFRASLPANMPWSLPYVCWDAA